MNSGRCEVVPDRDRRGRRAVLLIAAALVLAGVMSWRFSAPAASLPVERVLVSTGWADERSCAECHEQAREFAETGHARTLRRATDADLRELLLRLNNTPAASAEGLHIDLTADSIRAVQAAQGQERSVGLEWCFGSGHHARTWAGLLTDSWGNTDLLEFRWTWYSSLDGFAVTPGQSHEVQWGYFGALGGLYDPPKARRCFSCHATQLTFDDGRLDPHRLQPGVTCQRCHGPRASHVDSGGAISDFSWHGISQMESVNRCAECHRRADEQKPGAVRPDNVEIVRFQPVGLVQSACFQGSRELTCLTCHDPHRPMSAQDSRGDWQCTQCHDGADVQRPVCSAMRTGDCVRCHMPRVRGNNPLQFTDHWIRIRSGSESTP